MTAHQTITLRAFPDEIPDPGQSPASPSTMPASPVRLVGASRTGLTSCRRPNGVDELDDQEVIVSTTWLAGQQAFLAPLVSTEGQVIPVNVPIAGMRMERAVIDVTLHARFGELPDNSTIWEYAATPMYVGLTWYQDAHGEGQDFPLPWDHRDNTFWLDWRRIDWDPVPNQWTTDSHWGVRWHHHYDITYTSGPSVGDPGDGLWVCWQPDHDDYSSLYEIEAIASGRLAVVSP